MQYKYVEGVRVNLGVGIPTYYPVEEFLTEQQRFALNNGGVVLSEDDHFQDAATAQTNDKDTCSYVLVLA